MIRTRTLGVTLLSLLLLFFALVNLARVFQTVQKWQFLAELLPIWPGYLAISGLVWFAVGGWIFWALWTRRGMGSSLLIAIGLYSINFWLEKSWMVFRAGAPQDGNWPFLLLVNAMILAWGAWELFRPGNRRRDEERYERQRKD